MGVDMFGNGKGCLLSSGDYDNNKPTRFGTRILHHRLCYIKE